MITDNRFVQHLAGWLIIFSFSLLPLAVTAQTGDDAGYREEITDISANQVNAELAKAQNALTDLAKAIEQAVAETARNAAREAAQQAIMEAIAPTIKHAYKEALNKAAIIEQAAIEAAANQALQKQPANIRPLISQLKKNLLEKFAVEAAAKDRTSSEQIPGVIRQTIEARAQAEEALKELALAIQKISEQAIAQPLEEEEGAPATPAESGTEP